MRNKWLILVSFIFLVGVAYASFRGDMQTLGFTFKGRNVTTYGTFKIGTTGTAASNIKYSTLTWLDASTTTQNCTVAGVLPGDKVVVFANTAYSAAAYLKSAVCTTNTVAIVYSADPATTVTLSAIISR